MKKQTTFVSVFRKLSSFLVSMLFFMVPNISGVKAQVNITAFNSPYTQNFNNMGTSTFNLTDNTTTNFEGWYALRASSNVSPNVFTVGTGSSGTGSFYNYGSSSAADRAMGTLNSGSTGAINYGVRLKNTTGARIDYLTISYTGEQWRMGNNATPQSLTVDYQIANTITSLTTGTWTSIPALTFTSLVNTTTTATALDGNATANRTANITTTLAITLNAGDEIFIRWTDVDHAGNDHGLAVDDLSITAITPTNWYYKGTGAFNVTSNWSSNVNGVGGSSPSDFSSGVQIFNILDNPSATVNTFTTNGMGNWNITGSCRVKLGGTNSNPITLTIQSGNDITGTFDISQSNSSSGNTVIVSSTIPSFSTLHSSSTVEFSGSNSQTLPSTNYGSIVSSNSGARVINGEIGVAGSFALGSNTWTTTGATINFNGSNTVASPQIIPTISTDNIKINNNCLLPSGNVLTISAFTTSFIVASGFTLNISGKIVFNGTTTSSVYFNTTGSTINMLSGSEYQIAGDGGALPTANWNSNSLLNITGLAAAGSINNRNQIFGNVIWNCPNQTVTMAWPTSTLPGTFGTTGTFTLQNTGSTTLSLVGSNQASATFYNYTQTGGIASIHTGSATGDRTLIVSNAFNMSGGTLNLYTPTTGSLTYSGYLIVKGNFTHTAGTIANNPTNAIGTGVVTFDGTTEQIVSCSSLSLPALNINNTAGVKLSSMIINNSLSLILGRLTTMGNLTLGTSAIVTLAAGTVFSINNGTTDFTNRPVTLKSDATGTASIAAITGTLSNATNVTVERFIPGKRAFRFFAHPFSNAIALNQLTGAGEIDITGAGGATNGFTTTTTNNPSAFSYNTANGNSALSPDPGWEAYTSANTASWASRQGIRILVRGAKGEGLDGNAYTPSAATIFMTGTLNDGSSPTFTLTSSANSNYNLIGNPLASPIDLSLTTRGSAVSSNFSVWNPDVTNAGNKGVYVTQPFATPYILPIGSAFFAQTSDGAANNTIQFTESSKSAATPASLFRGSSTFGTNSMNLELTDSVGYADRLLIFFDKNQSSANKDWWDADKLMNPDVNFYSTSSDNYNLSIDARPFPTVGGAEMIIPVKLYSAVAKTLTLTAKDFDIQDSRDVLLHDKYTGTWTILNKDVQYSFTVTTDALTQGNRFEIVMRGSNSLPVNILNVSAAQKNAGIEVNWNTASESNMDSYEVEESSNATTFTKAATVAAKNGASNAYNWFDATVNNGDNYYRIKAIEKNGTVKYSNVVKVKIGGKNAEFTVYPNPVKDGIINLQMSNVEKGVYTVKIFNNAGQEVANRRIINNGGSATETITLDKGIAKGNYKMQITNGTTSVIKSVIVE